MASKRFEDDLRERLKRPEFAAAYLKAAMEDDAISGGVDGLLHAIREIAISHEGGISAAAQAANVGRQTIYDSFKEGGNPQIRTVDAVLRTVGMRLGVVEISKQQSEAAA